MLGGIAKTEDPDHFGRQAVFEILENLLFIYLHFQSKPLMTLDFRN